MMILHAFVLLIQYSMLPNTALEKHLFLRQTNHKTKKAVLFSLCNRISTSLYVKLIFSMSRLLGSLKGTCLPYMVIWEGFLYANEQRNLECVGCTMSITYSFIINAIFLNMSQVRVIV